MVVEPTPPLSQQGSAEVRQEMEVAPEATPERLATFGAIRELEATGRGFPKPDGTVKRK